MTQRRITRRNALQIGVVATTLPLVHIRSAGAAGKLKVALTKSFVPGADVALSKLIGQWGKETKTAVQVDSVSDTALTLAAEAQARIGHDVVRVIYTSVNQYAQLLAPVDDVVGRLQQQYGPVNETIEYVGKVDGHWAAVPTTLFSYVFPYVARIDVFQQQLGMDLLQIFPTKGEMGPGYDHWTWEAFLHAAAKCAKAGMPFGLPISPCSDADAWLGALFRSYGAELVDVEGNIAVNSEPVRTVLDYMKRLTPHLPGGVNSWDNASNNRALISGQSALIINPPSAWASAVKDQPQVGSQCWHFPMPAGPKGRFTPINPSFLGVWQFSANKSAAKELIEWLGQREQAEKVCVVDRGYDIPPFLSMSDFKVWDDEGPPKGTLSNYPIKPGHHAIATISGYPAPPDVAFQIVNLYVMENMIAKVTQSGQSIDQAIAWARRELEGLRR
jgi:ABC-type glycerol-3-phosphate transport system substrate-binding protein